MRRLAPWLGPAALAAAVAPFVKSDGGDTWLFVAAGKTLLSHDWSHAFASAGIQAGPLQLALYGSAGRSPALLAALLGAGTAVLVVAAAHAAGVERPLLLGLAGFAAVATGLTTHAFDAGHPADAMLPLLWIVAGAQARRGRALAAAAIVGLSAGLETWGILGVAVLALAPRARAVLAAAGIAVALYLPFVLSGHFAMGSYHWAVSEQSLLGQVVAPGTSFGWALRLAQGALAVTAGIAVAGIARRSAHALWLIPLAVVLVRIALDPLDSGYYFDGLQAPALVALALVAARGLRVPRLAREPVA